MRKAWLVIYYSVNFLFCVYVVLYWNVFIKIVNDDSKI